ncbi:hypothetical protein B0H13DRAFT_2266024 [Mycena leptocephala]|nr:hypothetical protein B0H13DRAFT_2266024 [Mycena leptocephala]
MSSSPSSLQPTFHSGGHCHPPHGSLYACNASNAERRKEGRKARRRIVLSYIISRERRTMNAYRPAVSQCKHEKSLTRAYANVHLGVMCMRPTLTETLDSFSTDFYDIAPALTRFCLSTTPSSDAHRAPMVNAARDAHAPIRIRERPPGAAPPPPPSAKAAATDESWCRCGCAGDGLMRRALRFRKRAAGAVEVLDVCGVKSFGHHIFVLQSPFAYVVFFPKCVLNIHELERERWAVEQGRGGSRTSPRQKQIFGCQEKFQMRGAIGSRWAMLMVQAIGIRVLNILVDVRAHVSVAQVDLFGRGEGKISGHS